MIEQTGIAGACGAPQGCFPAVSVLAWWAWAAQAPEGREWVQSDTMTAAACGLWATGLPSPGRLLANCHGSGGGFSVGSGFVEGVSLPAEKFPMDCPDPVGKDGHVRVGCA